MRQRRTPARLALVLAVAATLGACARETRWLEVARVEPAAPSAGAPAVLFLNQEITVHFTEPLDAASVSPESFRVVDERGHAVPGDLEIGRRSVRFRPVPPVAADLADGSFRPGGRYHLELPGMPTIYAIRSSSGHTLSRGITRAFAVPDAPGALGLPTLFLPVDAGVEPLMLDLTAGMPLRMPADAPVLDLHFTRPLLPSSVTPDAFHFLRVVSGRDEPEVLTPERVSIVPRKLPYTRHFGCSVQVELGADDGLVAGDLVYLVFADPEHGLRDYRDRPLTPPDVPLQVRVDPGDRPVVGDLDVADLDIRATGRVPLGFEVRDGRIRPRARVEAGTGRLGWLRPEADTTITVGAPFAFPSGDDGPVPAEIELLGLDVPAGVVLRIVADHPVVLRVVGAVRIAGTLVLDTPRVPVPWPAGTLVDPPQLVRAAGVALVTAGPVEVAGRVVPARPEQEGSPWTVISAGGVTARGRLPRDSVLALEADARFDGLAEGAVLLHTTMTPGLPRGVELEAEAWTAWLPLPAPHADNLDVRVVDPRGDLQLQVFLAPAAAVASGAAFDDLPLVAVPVQLPLTTEVAAPPGVMLRLEMTATVRGPELPSFGGFTVHDHRPR